VLVVDGPARAILAAERTALNLLGHLSGIATLTELYVKEVAGTGARIVCTRKTTPGLRALEKHAVRCGGGANHRFGLDDGVLIKDNHLAVAGSVREAVERVRRAVGHMVKIEVEVDTLAQLDEALQVGVDAVLLDNMSPSTLEQAVLRVDGKVVTEASGGISLTTAAVVAATGVDLLSVGALTHSAPVLDVGLDL
jgi:nicotinate-nucleotide pyrophosphorylase (carboxylating)